MFDNFSTLLLLLLLLPLSRSCTGHSSNSTGVLYCPAQVAAPRRSLAAFRADDYWQKSHDFLSATCSPGEGPLRDRRCCPAHCKAVSLQQPRTVAFSGHHKSGSVLALKLLTAMRRVVPAQMSWASHGASRMCPRDMVSRIIFARDPFELLASGLIYHRNTTEKWAKAASNGSSESYQQYVQRLDDEEAIFAEFRHSNLCAMDMAQDVNSTLELMAAPLPSDMPHAIVCQEHVLEDYAGVMRMIGILTGLNNKRMEHWLWEARVFDPKMDQRAAQHIHLSASDKQAKVQLREILTEHAEVNKFLQRLAQVDMDGFCSLPWAQASEIWYLYYARWLRMSFDRGGALPADQGIAWPDLYHLDHAEPRISAILKTCPPRPTVRSQRRFRDLG